MTTFFVAGRPVPKGSTRAFVVRGRTVTTATNADQQRPWAAAIAAEALAAGMRVTDAAVEVELLFRFMRPKSHFGKRGLRPSAPVNMVVRPDLDKLTRCVLDALTGVAWRDDAQVTCVRARKDYGLVPGVQITLEEQS